MPSLDLALLRLALTTGHTPARDRAAARFSTLGEHAAIWLAMGAAGAALDAPRRPQWSRGLATIAVAYAANVTVKMAVRRPRPQLEDLPPLVPTPTQLSFPSSHATSSFAAARAYGRIVPAARGALYALAVSLAASRLWLGVHYPSDLAAGAALGTVIAR